MTDDDRLRLDAAEAVGFDLLFAHGPLPRDATKEQVHERMQLIADGVNAMLDGKCVVVRDQPHATP